MKVSITTINDIQRFTISTTSSETAKAIAAAVKAEGLLDSVILSDDFDEIKVITKAEHDALDPPDDRILYLLT